MSRGTTHRTVRIEDGLWERAKEVAERRDEKLSAVIRRALELYADDRHVQPSDPYDSVSRAHVAHCQECWARFGDPTAARPK